MPLFAFDVSLHPLEEILLLSWVSNDGDWYVLKPVCFAALPIRTMKFMISAPVMPDSDCLGPEAQPAASKAKIKIRARTTYFLEFC